MPKTVTIGIKVDAHFVSMLNTTVALGRLREKDRQLTALEQLGLVALVEMRGGMLDQVKEITRLEWRDNITVVPDMRKVEEDGEI